VQREREEGSQIDDNLHHLPMIFSGSGAQQRLEKLVSMAVRSCSERGSGEEANEWQARAPEGVLGFIWSWWSRCRVHLVGHGWARGAAFLGQRCELSAALGVATSVAKWFGRDGCVFIALACETVHGAASWVG
jgi:hypothetical protein